MIDDFHLMIDILIFGGAVHQSLIRILEHFIDIAHVIHFLLHLNE
jgi:hypothetical protein